MVYYENPLFPEFNGRVLMSVLKDKRIIAMQLNATGTAVADEDHYLINQFGRLRDICVGPEKEIYLATNGASWSNTNPNTHSIIVLRALDDASIGQLDQEMVQVYPNPIQENVTIEITENLLGAAITICDLSGRIVVESVLSDLSQTLNTNNLPKGIYELKITTKDGGFISRKLVK
jgi:hypothetical protein